MIFGFNISMDRSHIEKESYLNYFFIGFRFVELSKKLHESIVSLKSLAQLKDKVW
jgi:hypothetical protein